MIQAWSAVPVSKIRYHFDLPLGAVPTCEDRHVSVLARVRVRNEGERAWERASAHNMWRSPRIEVHRRNVTWKPTQSPPGERPIGSRPMAVWGNLCCRACRWGQVVPICSSQLTKLHTRYRDCESMDREIQSLLCPVHSSELFMYWS